MEKFETKRELKSMKNLIEVRSKQIMAKTQKSDEVNLRIGSVMCAIFAYEIRNQSPPWAQAIYYLSAFVFLISFPSVRRFVTWLFSN
jgi:hypothetical protein